MASHTADITSDLDATIASAVNARIEAAVTQALASDEVLGRYVTAALQQPVDPRGNYNREKITFLQHTLSKAIQEATKAAVIKVLTEDRDEIEDQVRKALRRNVAGMADQIATSLAERATKGYGVTVELRVPGDSH